MCSRNADFPAFRLPSSVPLHIIRRFTQYYRNDYAGIEQFAQDQDTGLINARNVETQKDFAELWSRNLTEQGFFAIASAIFSSLDG